MYNGRVYVPICIPSIIICIPVGCRCNTYALPALHITQLAVMQYHAYTDIFSKPLRLTLQKKNGMQSMQMYVDIS